MADTNFAALTAEQKTAWSRDFWKETRNKSFLMNFMGNGSDSMIQRVTELKKDEKGARAVITLVHDMITDGVTGDYQLENNEEALQSDEMVIRIDQLRNANRSAGRMAEQKSIVNFREQSKDKLSYWMADRIDQMGFLTLAGIAYTRNCDGSLRTVRSTGQNLGDLEFAADVSAPTANRSRRWSAASGGNLLAGDTASIAADDRMCYNALLELKTYAEKQYIKPIRGYGGTAAYRVFVSPDQMKHLKMDPDFKANLRDAAVRSDSNSVFKGADVFYVDGLEIVSHRYVFNTLGAANASKWGSGGLVNGARAVLCGAQAAAFAAIGEAYWEEDVFDYGNKSAISIGKILGWRKARFKTSRTAGVTEDFSVVTLDTAI